MKAILLSAVLLASLSAVSAVPESSSDRFDFTTTLYIYHMVDGGGIIYQAPIDYDKNVGSVIVYEALDQYMAELSNPVNRDFFIQPSHKPLLDKFVFVNGVSQKAYFLKEYWLGDGEKWVPMNPSDYIKLRNMIDARRAVGGNVNPAEELEDFTAEVHLSGQQDVDPAWGPDQGHQEEHLAEDSANDERPPHSSGPAVVANNRSLRDNLHLNEEDLKRGQSEGATAEASSSIDIASKRSSQDQGAAIREVVASRSTNMATNQFLPDQSAAIGGEGGHNASPDQQIADTGRPRNGKRIAVVILSILFLCYFLYVRRKR